MSSILFKLNGTPSLITQYSMIYIFFLDFKCLVILGPSLDILYCAVFSSVLHYTLLSNISGLQFFSESILLNTSTGKSFTQSIPLIYLNDYSLSIYSMIKIKHSFENYLKIN